LPDADDVGDNQDAGALMRLVGGRGRKVGVVFVGDLDDLAGGSATGKVLSVMHRGEEQDASGKRTRA
jgi:hypothetical protein